MNTLKNNEQIEIKQKGWTKEEKEQLIEMYPYKTTKELCNILDKSEGQIRGMKERLGLNQKLKIFTIEEKEMIIDFYKNNPNEIDLDNFANLINRPKTSISRFAKQIGLTKNNRKLSDSSLLKRQESYNKYIESDYYKNIVYPRQVESLSYYAKNNHPQGMLGKHHTEETKKQMSETHIALAQNMSNDEKHLIAMKGVETRRKNGSIETTSNAYSRCKGGKRLDLNCYFRSAWEANVARLLNFLNINWLYEYKRFDFYNEENGILSYQPDFYLPQYNKWIEVKGWMDDKSIKRLSLFNEYYPYEYKNLFLIDEAEYKKINTKYKNIIPCWE